MRTEFELDFQARVLVKERDWALKSEKLRHDTESEKAAALSKIAKLQKSHEDMK